MKLNGKTIALSVRLRVSPDAKILLFVLCVFILILLKVQDARFDAAVLALGGALVSGLIKDHKANELDVEVAEKGLGERVTAIKQAARGDKGVAEAPKTP